MHAKERNAYIRQIDPKNDSGSGMTDAEADAILNIINSDPAARADCRQYPMVCKILWKLQER